MPPGVSLPVAKCLPWVVFLRLSAALAWLYSEAYSKVLISVQSKGSISVGMSHKYEYLTHKQHGLLSGVALGAKTKPI
jgi:hypothetical protein